MPIQNRKRCKSRGNCLPLLLALGTVVDNGATSFGDIAPDPQSGGKTLAVRGGVKTDVVMVDEIVKLQLSKDECSVDVVFTMENTGEQAETLEVGFPYNYPDELKGFTASVDYKTIKVRDTGKVPDNKVTKRTSRKNPDWMLWETTFKPEAHVRIAVSYSTKLTSHNSWLIGTHSLENSLERLVPKDDFAALQTRLRGNWVEYVLKSGGHWSGPIGRCRIEVTFVGLTTDNLTLDSPHFEPDRATITRDKIVWDLKDYEPRNDVRLRITPGITRKETLALLEKYQKSHPDEVDITEMLNDYLIAFDRKREADKLVMDLLKRWQDRIVIWGPGSENQTTLRQSSYILGLIRHRTVDDLLDLGKHTRTFENPREFVPVIERITQRLRIQMDHVPQEKIHRTIRFGESLDQLDKWCRKHGRPE